MTSHNIPTGNVVVDPDSVWELNSEGIAVRKKGPDGKPVEGRSVNPHNIAEDLFYGQGPTKRHKFGTIFQKEVEASMAAEKAAANEVVDPDDSGLQNFEALDYEDLDALIHAIKRYSEMAKEGDTVADHRLLEITSREYKRVDGGRMRIKGLLAAYGYKKPSKA